MLQTDLIKAQTADSRNLLIALHGLGDSMEGYRWLPQMLQVPTLNVLLVNAPDAYYGGFSWYDFAADPGPGVERSYNALKALMDDYRAKGYPTERTILFGFSQGCLMTVETGLRYGQRLAGLVGMSGYVHEPQRLLRLQSPFAKAQRALITHGTDDPLIPLRDVQKQYEQLIAAGVQIDFRIYQKAHTIIEAEIDCIRTFVVERLNVN